MNHFSKEININGKIYRMVENHQLNEAKLYHEFTRGDWAGYAGAVEMPDGSQPLIYSSDEVGHPMVDIILGGSEDYNGYSIYMAYFDNDDVTGEAGDGHDWIIDLPDYDKDEALDEFEDIIHVVEKVKEGPREYNAIRSIANRHGMDQIN